MGLLRCKLRGIGGHYKGSRSLCTDIPGGVGQRNSFRKGVRAMKPLSGGTYGREGLLFKAFWEGEVPVLTPYSQRVSLFCLCFYQVARDEQNSPC